MVIEIIDIAHLNHQTFDDPALKCEILGMFQEQAPLLIAAIDAQSGPARSDTAHRLKGSAVAIGAMQLAAAADALEQAPAAAAALQALHVACDKTMQAIAQLLLE
jgi:HPt (histidine-containing phosphotransfer) domain-containing protein